MRALRALGVVLLTGAVLVALAASTEAGRPQTSAAESPVEPAAPAVPTVSDLAAHEVAAMDLRAQAMSIVMGHIPGTDAAALSAYMAKGLGGFILMGSNVPATEGELRALTTALAASADPSPLIAIDQEGGVVSRLPWDRWPASTTLKSLPAADTHAAFTARGEALRAAGVTVNFGTVADVTADPMSFIHGRALGTDPASAAERVSAATIAQEAFVVSTLKHFPGHGAAPGDSHHAIPMTALGLDAWRQTDAVPFQAGIDAGASLLMFGHLAYTAVDPAPASLSPRWHEIARDELGFDGVTVTDDLGMLQGSGLAEYADPVANAVRAVAAGNDLLLVIAGSTPETAGRIADGLVAAVDSGVLPEERLADAATRVLALRMRIAGVTVTPWTAP